MGAPECWLPVTEFPRFLCSAPRDFLAHRKHWGRRLKVWRPRLWRSRPLSPSLVSDAIEAGTAAAAIFERLYQVDRAALTEGVGDDS